MLCLGLSGVGKTTLLSNLVDEPMIKSEPTTGFNIKTLPLKNTVLSIKELGGSLRIQPFWDHYFSNKHAILFVVNANDSESELCAAKNTLESVFSDVRLKSKPCLILGTHGDLDGSRRPEDIETIFSSIMGGRKWCVFCCSAYDRAQIITAFEILIDLMVVV